MEQLQKITVVFALVSYVAFGFSQYKLKPTVIYMVGRENLDTKSEEVVLYCAGSRLDGDLLLKRNLIQIGLLGSYKDPLLLTFCSDEIDALSGSQCTVSASGYLPPILEYLIVFHHLAVINNSTSILPYHKVCVVLEVSSNLQQNLNSAFFHFVEGSQVVAVIDALKDKY